MKVEKTPIRDLLVVTPNIFEDERGYFFESFNNKKYSEFLPKHKFVQDNISKSKQGVIRGLHYQVGEHAQGKLCSVLEGKALDVAVDIRFKSPTFGMHYSLELSDENKKQFWIPPGFAHGFSVLSEWVIFSYKCTSLYDKESERSIIFNDPHLKIDWMVENPIVSDKDLHSIKFNEIDEDFTYE